MSKKTITAYKGFNQDFQCRGFQYEIGKTYKHDGKVSACESGFHACLNPLDVFGYYRPGCSRYAVVELSGKTDDKSDDSKIAAAKITVTAEISLPDFIQKAVEYIFSKVNWSDASETNTGDYSAATNTGYQSAATNTGEDGVALASGYQGRVSGAEGCALFLVERNDDLEIVNAWAGIVGKDGIKPDVFYMLKDGKPVEVAE